MPGFTSCCAQGRPPKQAPNPGKNADHRQHSPPPWPHSLWSSRICSRAALEYHPMDRSSALKILGLRLQKRREEAGLTEAELAERARISPSAIGDFERGAG